MNVSLPDQDARPQWELDHGLQPCQKLPSWSLLGLKILESEVSKTGEKKTEVRKREIKGGDVMGVRWVGPHLNPITHFQDSDFHSEMEPGQE